ncbi:uncharacterized protein LOC131691425 [Topomyia yanbarensis]|uniref:uncharacterized protein LOC131691425 n=1 Tax=Topomyia yanbarensis TaxID=2498891 RepID=UPI00273B3323|nr:uncharacterized protein LOC131691425 [Topomyia yanbarensis]
MAEGEIPSDVIMEVPDPPNTRIAPRIKQYPEGSSGPWVVYFRTGEKPVNILKLSRDLTANYPAVTQITRVRANKIRVLVSDLGQANAIACCERFTREFKAYVPCVACEIDGVVSEPGLKCEELLEHGVGCFKDPSLEQIKILECKQLYTANTEGGKTTYSLSGSIRVTFAGSSLPNYILLDKVRLPVRLFVPRVMNCSNCKQLGHTATYCGNKKRCGKCEGEHEDDSCDKETEKCICCGGPSHALKSCPAYKQRGDKIKRSLKERSRRSYAEMLKNASPSVLSENPYAGLANVQQESDDPREGTSLVNPGESRKRRNPASPTLPRKGAKVSSTQSAPSTTNKSNGSDAQKPKQFAPGLGNINSNKEYPPLPGTSKTPSVHFFQTDTQSSSGLMKFSDIVDLIFTAFNVTDPLKSLLIRFLPIVQKFLKQLTTKWPLLAAIVSFDD